MREIPATREREGLWRLLDAPWSVVPACPAVRRRPGSPGSWCATPLAREARERLAASGGCAADDGWPTPGERSGPWWPFVWFRSDVPVRHDGATNHTLTVVTGIVVRRDPSLDQAELLQALDAYYPMRNAIVDDAEDADSPFNAGWAGFAQAADSGIEPADGDDFDGVMTIGEDWTVLGKE